MTLAAGCPRCPAPVRHEARRWTCPDHGQVAPLWRATTPEYDSFAEHLRLSAPLPTWLPWPLASGWQVTDFGCVAEPDFDARACFATATGLSDLDGIIEVTVVTEEPGVGLGARCAGLARTDPGADITGAPHAKVRVEGHPIALWSISTSDDQDAPLDRSVFAGEAQGRWLWLVLRPASAALLLGHGWNLRDVSGLGPELVTLPFGDVPRAW